MTNTNTTRITTRNRNARLAPLTGAEYVTLNGWARQHDPAVCPCCEQTTSRGWLDDQGCCYQCSVSFDQHARHIPPAAGTLDVRLVESGGKIYLTGLGL